MKTLIAALFVTATLSSAFAAPVKVASCSGDHHGTYLDISEENNVLTIETSNDGEEAPVKWKLVSMKKSIHKLKDAKAASWAIRQAIKMPGEMDGVVTLKATNGKNTMLVNFATYAGNHFVVVNDYVELMTCAE